MESFGEKRKKRKTLSPADIMRARREYNPALLRAAGKKGAEKTNQMKDEKKAYAEAYEAYRAEQEAAAMAKLQESTNEHLVPIDSEDEREA